jgi:hypothetical protein
MAELYCSDRIMALGMRRGGRSRHASTKFDAGARHVASFHHDAFHHDTSVRNDTDAARIDAACGNITRRGEPETSSGHDRITADASASGGKDADHRTGTRKAAGT